MKPLLPAFAIGVAIILFWIIPKFFKKHETKARTTKVLPTFTIEATGPKIHYEKLSAHSIALPPKRTSWRDIHQRIVGIAILIYGLYLATLTGTITQFVLPGVGAIGGGAVAGAGVGLVTYIVLGTVGAVTGGVGVALGLLAMTLIGGSVGALGAAAGGVGFRTVSYPLVSAWFWVPVIIIGIYVFLGVGKSRSARKISKSL
jgi:hypothetical protein